MTWQIELEGPTCIASGMCAALAPDHFELEGEHAEALATEIEPDEIVLEVADSCPVQAIYVREAGKLIGPRP